MLEGQHGTALKDTKVGQQAMLLALKMMERRVYTTIAREDDEEDPYKVPVWIDDAMRYWYSGRGSWPKL